MPPYSFNAQIKIVIACIAIHNFLWKLSITDALFLEYDNEEVELEKKTNLNQPTNANNLFGPSHQVFMQQLWDQLTNQLS